MKVLIALIIVASVLTVPVCGKGIFQNMIE
jgi:hypothetical protein